MTEHLPKALEGWHDFYLIVGTGAAALTGLLFVIVSLGPHVVARQRMPGVRAFISPVAVHFTFVLVMSSVMVAPEIPAPLLGWSLAAAGLGGIVFSLWIRVHRRWRENKLVPLDWIWFVALPFVCFAGLVASGAGIATREPLGPYGVAAVSLLLIVVAIRNAWDLVLWVAQQPRLEAPEQKPPQPQHPRRKR